MTPSFNEAFNAFTSIATNAKRTGADKATGDCPICGDHTLKLWQHPNGAKAWVIGCDHRKHCSFAPVGLSSWCWEHRKELWTQLKRASTTAPVVSGSQLPVVPANWATDNDTWIRGYLNALQPLSDQARTYVQSRKLPESEWSKWRWSKRTTAIIIPVEDRKGRFVSAKRRFLASQPGQNRRWSVVMDVVANKQKQRLWQPPGHLYYGLHRISPANPVVICEGTFDALAFSNGLSVEGVNNITFELVEQFRKHLPHRLWCADNDGEGKKKATMLQGLGETVLNIPASHKDANDWLTSVTDATLDRFISETGKQSPSGSCQATAKGTASGFASIFKKSIADINT